MKFTIDFEPIGRRCEIDEHENILEAAQNAGIELVSICGGVGSCNGCQIRIITGEMTPVTETELVLFSSEEISEGNRLACQTRPKSNIKIYIPPESLTTPQRLQIEGHEVFSGSDPVITSHEVNLPHPNMTDQISDTERLTKSLSGYSKDNLKVAYPALTSISDDLRSQNWQASVAMRYGEVVAILPKSSKPIGLAVDIGTTKIAAYLLDLTSGETIAKTGVMNPQISYGEDVVSRIAFANLHDNGRKLLQEKLIETLNSIIKQMCAESGFSHAHIVEAVIVGNTVIHHLFAGLPVHQLGMAPYIPAVSCHLDIPARDLGLAMAPGAYVYLPPNIAGYVGADHVAMVLASEIFQASDTVMALDIGTNTEISLAHKGRLFCTSCASGPAFEGAHIQDGMRAAAGAIERVKISDGVIHTHTINNQPPIGICGSGILDVIASMLKAGIIDRRGTLNVESDHIVGTGKDRQFILTPAKFTGHGKNISISRSDINEIQLAKGAIRTGINILLEKAGITAENLDRFIIAGAFGTYLDIHSAVEIGMFPQLSSDRYSQIGNAAGTGARILLVSSTSRQVVNDFIKRMEYVELTTQANFQKVFLSAMYF